MAKDKQPPKTKKYFRSTKSGAGMTTAGVKKQLSQVKLNLDLKLPKDVNLIVLEALGRWNNFPKQQLTRSLDLDKQGRDGSVKKWILNT